MSTMELATFQEPLKTLRKENIIVESNSDAAWPSTSSYLLASQCECPGLCAASTRGGASLEEKLTAHTQTSCGDMSFKGLPSLSIRSIFIEAIYYMSKGGSKSSQVQTENESVFILFTPMAFVSPFIS